MDVPFRRVAGRFYRAMPVARVADVLDPPGPDSAGRYHRPGEPALYLTPEPDWAMIAVGRYLTVDGPRVVVPVEVSGADVVDQRDPATCHTLGIDPVAAAGRWQHALAEGREPAFLGGIGRGASSRCGRHHRSVARDRRRMARHAVSLEWTWWPPRDRGWRSARDRL